MEPVITDITVIRHGQTPANRLGIFQGQIETHLDDLGRKQAACAADRLKGEYFDVLFCSDLARARETAAILLRQITVGEIVYEPALREWSIGELEGRPVAEVRAKAPELVKSFAWEDPGFRIPGGESRQELYDRVSRFLEGLANGPYKGKRILLVTHAGTLRMVFQHITGGLRPGSILVKSANASLSQFLRNGDRWQLCVWNDTGHLLHAEQHESVAP